MLVYLAYLVVGVSNRKNWDTVIEPCARTLELPLLARSSTFSFFFMPWARDTGGQFSLCSRPPTIIQ